MERKEEWRYERVSREAVGFLWGLTQCLDDFLHNKRSIRREKIWKRWCFIIPIRAISRRWRLHCDSAEWVPGTPYEGSHDAVEVLMHWARRSFQAPLPFLKGEVGGGRVVLQRESREGCVTFLCHRHTSRDTPGQDKEKKRGGGMLTETGGRKNFSYNCTVFGFFSKILSSFCVFGRLFAN